MRVFRAGLCDILHRSHMNILIQAPALGVPTFWLMTDQGTARTEGGGTVVTLKACEARIRSRSCAS